VTLVAIVSAISGVKAARQTVLFMAGLIVAALPAILLLLHPAWNFEKISGAFAG